MNVGELMAQLSHLPLDTPVICSSDPEETFPAHVNMVTIEKVRAYSRDSDGYVSRLRRMNAIDIRDYTIGETFKAVCLSPSERK